MAGMLHAKFRYADHTHARITRIDTTSARELPGVFAVITQGDVPDVRYGGVHPGPHAVREGRGAVRGRDRRRRRGAHARDRGAGGRADRGRLRATAARSRTSRPRSQTGTTLVHADWESYGAMDELVRDRNDASPLDDRQGRRRGRPWPSADVVVRERYVADMSHAVPIEPHAIVAHWLGSKVTVWSSTQVPVHRPLRRRDHPGDPRVERPHHRPLPGRRFRRQVRVPLRGPHRRAGPRRPAAGAAGVQPPRGVPRARPPPRGPGDRAGDRRHEGRHAGRPPRPADPRQRRLQRRRPLLPPARRDDRRRPVQGAERVRRCQPGLHQHHAVGLGARPHGAAGLLGGRAAHGLGRRPARASTRWSCAARTSSARATRGRPGRCSTRSAPHETLDKAAEMIGYGRELPDDEAIGIACGWWPSFSIASGAYVKLNADGSGTIVTGAQECGTGAVMALPLLAAEVLGMQPEDFSLLYQDTDAGPFDSGRVRIADDLQQRPRRGEGGGGHPRAAADARGGCAGGVARRPRAGGRRRPGQGLADQERRASRRCARRPRATSSCSAAGRARPPPVPEVDASGCTGRLGMESFVAPHVHHARRARARSTARPASSGCSRSPRPTIRARC